MEMPSICPFMRSLWNRVSARSLLQMFKKCFCLFVCSKGSYIQHCSKSLIWSSQKDVLSVWTLKQSLCKRNFTKWAKLMRCVLDISSLIRWCVSQFHSRKIEVTLPTGFLSAIFIIYIYIYINYITDTKSVMNITLVLDYTTIHCLWYLSDMSWS